MKRIGKFFILLLTLAILLAAAVLAAGEAAPGTEGDPLVTLSYLNEVFADYVTGLFRQELDAHSARLEGRVAELELLSGSSAVWETVALQQGQSLKLSVGAELILRSGSATLTAGALADSTSGRSVQSGAQAEQNHLCMAAEEGLLRADSDVTLLLRGNRDGVG